MIVGNQYSKSGKLNPLLKLKYQDRNILKNQYL